MSEAAPRERSSGRGWLVALGAVGLVVAIQAGIGLWPNALPTEPVDGLAGYERLTGEGAASLPDLMTVGLDEAPELPRPDSALLHSGGPGVPVAVFTDANCPNCRVLEARLARREGLSVTWHDLPLLGPSSVLAARAAIAAERLGAPSLRQRLYASRLVPDEASLRVLALEEGLDPGALLEEMRSPEIDARLASSAALAGALGFYGTPGIVVGRIAALGALPDATLDALMEAAR